MFGSNAAKTFTSSRRQSERGGAVRSDRRHLGLLQDDRITNEPNTATYRHRFDSAFTMLGRPTVRAQIQTTGKFGEIAARLWDLMPNGQQRLVDRGVYSLNNNQTGQIVFQLHGNGYRFGKGHRVALQLLGRDSPYYQASNGVLGPGLEPLGQRCRELAK